MREVVLSCLCDRLKTFLESNVSLEAFLCRWRQVDNVLDVIASEVVCFEAPDNPLFEEEQQYFGFFREIMEVLKPGITSVWIRGDVFQYTGERQYLLCRRFNGNIIMWVLTRTG